MDEILITTLQEYKESYHVRLEKHINKYIDFDELHFINKQLYLYHQCLEIVNERYIFLETDKNYMSFSNYVVKKTIAETANYPDKIPDLKIVKMFDSNYIEPKPKNLDLDLEKLSQSFIKIISFLNELQDTITQKNQVEKISNTKSDGLYWLGDQIELTELLKALIEAGKLNVKSTKQNETFKRFRDFFNVPHFKEVERLSVIKKRTSTYTPFLHDLEIALEKWIKKGD